MLHQSGALLDPITYDLFANIVAQINPNEMQIVRPIPFASCLLHLALYPCKKCSDPERWGCFHLFADFSSATNNPQVVALIRILPIMSLLQTCLGLVRKYGAATKVVATGVLNIVAPGSGTLVDLAGQAIEAASHAAEELVEEQFRRELLARVKQNEAELARLGQLLEFLVGPLAKVCDKAASFADQPEDLPDIVSRAIAADPSLTQVLHQIGNLKEQFAVFQADIRRLADRQDEAAPVYVRMNRVADYFDELWQAGIPPKEFVRLLQDRTQAVSSIEQGQTAGLDLLIGNMSSKLPRSASVPLLEAAAAVREFNYPAAQRALATAIRLKPSDGELLELSRRVTTLATRSTPRQVSSTASGGGGAKRLQPGDVLDGWQLEMRLGAGGWGQVFKASREGQTRALKLIHPELAANRAFVERFKKEIATLYRLPRHPNLVRIDDFGFCPEQRTWYVTMEYIDGPTLEKYLASKGPFTEAQVHKVFAEVIESLAQAHAVGIVHRDIKPSNLIFRDNDQRLVLVDFGLAVEVEQIGYTQLSGLTVQFAAPEQLYGEPSTQSSDVFSLCAVIHYALQYDKPEQRKPNRFLPKQVPESLRELLSRGLAVNANDRLGNAEQLRQLFQAAKIKTSETKTPTVETKTQLTESRTQLPELPIQTAQTRLQEDKSVWPRSDSRSNSGDHNHNDNPEIVPQPSMIKSKKKKILFSLMIFLMILFSIGILFALTDPPASKSTQRDFERQKTASSNQKTTKANQQSNEWVPEWQKAGAKVGWMGQDRWGILSFQEKPDGLIQPIRAFSFLAWQEGTISKLPEPDEAFGLDLCHLAITDTGLKELVKLTNLQSLDLGGTQVTDAGLKELVKLTSLQKLNLWNTQVTDVGLKELAQLTSLQSLNLRNTQVTDAGLKELVKLTSLQSLYLWNTQVTDAGLKELVKLTSLQSLYLWNTQVTDAGLKELAQLTNLQSLDLGGTRVTDLGLKELLKLTSLQSLDLWNTRVTDAGLKELVKLTNLQSLNLRNTQVTDEGIRQLKRALPNCNIIK
jgi:serine/threonine protein kinase